MTFSRKDVPCARWNTMSFEFIKKLPTPAEIRKELPLPAELARIKEERDAEMLQKKYEMLKSVTSSPAKAISFW